MLSLQAWDGEDYSNAVTLRYVQRGPLTSVLSLQAWNAEEYSNTVTLMVGSLKMNTALEYSTRVVHTEKGADIKCY